MASAMRQRAFSMQETGSSAGTAVQLSGANSCRQTRGGHAMAVHDAQPASPDMRPYGLMSRVKQQSSLTS